MPRAGTWNCQLAVALDFDPELSHVRLYHAFQIANSSLVLQHWGMISFIHDLALNIGARNKRLRERRGPWNTSCILDLCIESIHCFLGGKCPPSSMSRRSRSPSESKATWRCAPVCTGLAHGGRKSLQQAPHLQRKRTAVTE